MRSIFNPVEVLARMTNMSLSYSNGFPVMFPNHNFVDTPPLKNGMRPSERLREFESTEQALRSFRAALAPVIDFADESFRNRAACLLNGIMRRSPGLPGQHPVAVSLFRSRLQNFEINDVRRFDHCTSDISSVLDGSQTSATTEFVLGDDMLVDGDVTHFRLIHSLGVMCDSCYDDMTMSFQPEFPEIDGIHAASYSDYRPVNSGDPHRLVMHTSLPVSSLPDEATLLEAIGIEFFYHCPDEDLYYIPVHGSAVVLRAS